jgi:hypothetical protein
MGNNEYGQSGIGNKNELKFIYKIDYFENKNLRIKKIVCGGFYGFNIFLTGF